MCGPSPMIFSGLGKLAETSSQAWPSSAVLCPSLRLSSVLTSPARRGVQGDQGTTAPSSHGRAPALFSSEVVGRIPGSCVGSVPSRNIMFHHTMVHCVTLPCRCRQEHSLSPISISLSRPISFDLCRIPVEIYGIIEFLLRKETLGPSHLLHGTPHRV